MTTFPTEWSVTTIVDVGYSVCYTSDLSTLPDPSNPTPKECAQIDNQEDCCVHVGVQSYQIDYEDPNADALREKFIGQATACEWLDGYDDPDPGDVSEKPFAWLCQEGYGHKLCAAATCPPWGHYPPSKCVGPYPSTSEYVNMDGMVVDDSR